MLTEWNKRNNAHGAVRKSAATAQTDYRRACHDQKSSKSHICFWKSGIH